MTASNDAPVRPGVPIVRTVLGDIPADDLGVTLPHEHLLLRQDHVSFREPDDAEGRALASRPVALDMLGWLQWHWASNLDNLVLDSEPLAIEELARYRDAGGRSVVDCTLPGIGRDPEALVRVARATGLHIVMGTGFYVEATHPPEVAAMSSDDVAARIVREVREGVDGTGIRAGLMGEVGCSWPMTDAEVKVLRGAALAQAELGCALSIHPGRHPDAPLEILGVLREAGADLGRVVMGHVERTAFRQDVLRPIADTGCFVEYDLFGTEVTATFPYRSGGIDIPTDAQRLDSIAALVAAGHGDQVLVSHDVCTKHRTRRYGGVGYDHILRDIVPWMPERGFDPGTIDRILVDNPRRAFALPAA